MFFVIEKILINYLSTKSQGNENSNLSFLDSVDANILLSYITIIEEEIPKLMYNINYKLWLDCIYSRFVEVK